MKKKKAGRKSVAYLLVAAMLMIWPDIPASAAAESGSAAATRISPTDPIHNCTKDNDKSGNTDKTKWSRVYFGSYPQAEVTGNALTAEIKNASYDADGDAWINGTKYRRICQSDINNTKYFGSGDYRYFKWEKIKWRVLRNDGNTLFVAADRGLDCKNYNETDASVTWESSGLRNWLNHDFYGAAFDDSEKNAVVQQTVVNEDNLYFGSIEGGNNTDDKVFLLSLSESINPAYGFCKDLNIYSASRRLRVSDYAHAMGVRTENGENHNYPDGCWWWLRSPGSKENIAAGVDYYGSVFYSGYYAHVNDAAVVPALHINFSSELWTLAEDEDESGGNTGGGNTGNTGNTGGDNTGGGDHTGGGDGGEKDKTPTEPDPGNKTPIEPDPGNKTPIEPDPGNKTPIEPDPGNKTPIEPDPGNKTPIEPDPGNKTPIEPDPGNKTPIEPDPGNKTPIEPDPGNKTPIEPDPGNKTPIEPDPGNKTPIEPDSGNKTPIEPNPGNKTPIEPDPGNKTPIEPDPGNKTPIEPGPGKDENQNQNSGTGGGNGTQTNIKKQAVKITVKPTSIKGKIKARKKGFFVKWKKQKGVTGYQVQYSTHKKFKKKKTKIKTVKKASKTKLTVKKLKAGKKYYVRVRTFKKINGTKYYSKWSKKKTVKTKK